MRAGRVPYRHTTRYYDLPYYVIVNYVVFICVAVNLLMSPQGQVLSAHVAGKVVMKSYLSGESR